LIESGAKGKGLKRFSAVSTNIVQECVGWLALSNKVTLFCRREETITVALAAMERNLRQSDADHALAIRAFEIGDDHSLARWSTLKELLLRDGFHVGFWRA
jgi:hypothetical protein